VQIDLLPEGGVQPRFGMQRRRDLGGHFARGSFPFRLSCGRRLSACEMPQPQIRSASKKTAPPDLGYQH
jgi:hypothetical protein